MHASVMEWVESVTRPFTFWRVLEVGSLNVNGSVRPLFPHTEYVGVDMLLGPGVDIVAKAHDMPFEDDYFDLVISTEMLEHDEQFWLSLPEMGRVLKPKGMMVLTTRGNGFPLHSYPDDLWRFMPDSAGPLMKLAGCQLTTLLEDPEQPGIFVAGIKP